jgi:hypothetical protein
MTVEIPADVKDNSPHTVRVQWRNVRDAKPDEVESGRRYLNTFGYTLYEWDDVDRDGTRVTLHRFVNREGRTVDLYATYYFTRVACHTGDWCYSYASHYILLLKDGEPTTDGPLPYCEDHQRFHPSLTVRRSERLVIGQHD